MTGVDEIFTVHVLSSTPAGLHERIQVIADALAQYRYMFTIDWDGDVRIYQGNGAGDLRVKDDNVDPVLHRAGWISLELTIPREPGLGTVPPAA
jgi:hypothetical protein